MTTIVKYEIEKLLKNKTFRGAMVVSLFVLAGILLIGFHYSQVQGQKGEGLELYHQVVKESTGEFSDQKVKEILANYMDRYQSTDEDSRTLDLFSWEIAETFFPQDKSVFDKMNAAVEQDEKITIDQIKLKTIKEIGFTQFQKPLKIGGYVTWTDLFKVTGHLFILTCILVILICSLVFSSDTSRNMNQLLLSTKFGRNKLTIGKIIAATLISIFVFLFMHIISLVSFYIYNNGFSGWDTSIQTNFLFDLFSFPVEINHLQVFFLAVTLHFISMLAIVGVTLYVSSIARSPFSALALSLGLFFLPKALAQLFKRDIIYKLLNLFPINNYRTEDFLTFMSSKQEYILSSFVQNVVSTMIILLIIQLVLVCLVYWRMKQYQVA